MEQHTLSQENGLRIELVVEGPLLVKSSSPAGFGLDASMMLVGHGPRRGTPCIPGTLLKGKLAEALETFHGVLPDAGFMRFREDWLGTESQRGGQPSASSVDPYRGRLVFDDLVAERVGSRAIRHRVSIEPETGAAAPQMLQVVETPAASGEPVRFVGHAWFLGGQPEELRRRLELALSFLTQLGAYRTTGFGRLVSTEVRLAELTEPSAQSDVEVEPGGTWPWQCRARHADPISAITPKHAAVTSEDTAVAVTSEDTAVAVMSQDAAHLAFTLEPLGPIAIARHKIGDNLYESERVIPGNVLAGAVAETWAALLGKRVPANGVAREFDPDRPELGEHFSILRFWHAFPSRAGNPRPQAVPLSVVSAGALGYRDLAALAAPVVFPNVEGKPLAPAFRVDWKGKDFEKVDPRFGWAEPARELRVRTAIDSVHRRADRGEPGKAEAEGKLFAQELIHPFSTSGEPLEWRGGIDLVDVPVDDRGKVAAQLAGILAVLSYLGKTKARCVATIAPGTAPPSRQVSLGGLLVLVLETPSLLVDPRFQDVPQVPRGGAIPSEALHRLYASTWSELSGGSLELSHFFATQSLAGGQYLYHRFQCRGVGKREPAPEYRPWLLTEPGSVFALRVRDPKHAAEFVGEWVSRGLPLPAWAVRAFGPSWETNPFIPTNGFGEVRLHDYLDPFPAPGPDEIATVLTEEAP